MRALLRNLIEKTRRLSGSGAERNAHLELLQPIERSSSSTASSEGCATHLLAAPPEPGVA